MNEVKFSTERFTPSKVVCVGRNYLEHIQELNNAVPEQPVIFIKPNSAISDVLKVEPDVTLSYEAELCFLVQGQTLVGVGLGLDLTDRALQTSLKAKGLPWERAKAFNGAAVFSHFVPLEGELGQLSLRLSINDVVVQQGGVAEMMMSPDALLDEAATFLQFEDNDILMTGTPKGVGPVLLGDRYVGQVYWGAQLLLECAWTVDVKT